MLSEKVEKILAGTAVEGEESGSSVLPVAATELSIAKAVVAGASCCVCCEVETEGAGGGETASALVAVSAFSARGAVVNGRWGRCSEAEIDEAVDGVTTG